jgi:hypothetical protein
MEEEEDRTGFELFRVARLNINSVKTLVPVNKEL